MTDYISRDALVKTTRETPFTMSMCLSVEECKGMNRARNILADIFEVLPAADVRPVVLCRDCMLRQYCKVAQYLGADGFCSSGEKVE